MRPLGDRRSRVRFEVVGGLWGTLEANRDARLLNISRSGALIVSPVPLAVDSIQTVRLMMKQNEFYVHARVRHVTPAAAQGGEEPQYEVGVEFLNVPIGVVKALE